MKKQIKSLLMAVALCAGLLIPISITPGCASANKNAYRTVSTVQISADAALTAWGDYVHNQKLNGTPVAASKSDQVESAYNKYQAAMLVVADAGAGYAKASNGTNAPTAQTILNYAIAAASASLGDLVDLVRTFGVKI